MKACLATVTIGVVLIAISSCTTTSQAQGGAGKAPGTHCEPGEILFSTIAADGQRIPRVEVRVASVERRLVSLGMTNELGEGCFSKSEVFAPDVVCTLFCKKNLHCTALVNEDRWKDFDELPIVLSPWVVF